VRGGVRGEESGVRSEESGVRSEESGVRSEEEGVGKKTIFPLGHFFLLSPYSLLLTPHIPVRVITRKKGVLLK